ncbi:MAG: pyruvate dehydrogenase (acetyl-transferring) E1 component subunit alpha [Gemmatimonadetes bacterium]|nr:pyruvate dehydrogenase (acetyl-transferring) E1 component subunit alpha [Gemmatimonadota bacterium]
MTAEPLQILRADGSVNGGEAPDIEPAELQRLHRLMILQRAFDKRALNLQRQGRIGFYVSAMGQEAAQIGSSYATGPEDWIFPAYRELGAALVRGVPLQAIVAQLYGNENDVGKGRQMPNHYGFRDYNVVTASSPVGTQIPIAVGAAWAARIRRDRTMVLVYFGDGATSTGEFHAGMNFAGVFRTPTVFFCQNNQWAISVPRERQTASETLAMKAEAYGFEGVRVDGNDLLAVISAARRAADKARSGDGPTMIEAVTYRMGGHSTADDPRRYREEREVSEWGERDPIVRFRRYLESLGLWNESDEAQAQDQAARDIEAMIQEEEEGGPPPLESLVEDVFSEVPWHLAEQLQELRARHDRKKPPGVGLIEKPEGSFP